MSQILYVLDGNGCIFSCFPQSSAVKWDPFSYNLYDISTVGSFVWSHLFNIQKTEDPLKKDLMESLPDDIISKDFEAEPWKYSSHTDYTVDTGTRHNVTFPAVSNRFLFMTLWFAAICNVWVVCLLQEWLLQTSRELWFSPLNLFFHVMLWRIWQFTS